MKYLKLNRALSSVIYNFLKLLFVAAEIWLLTPLQLIAQDRELIFEHYTTDHGLSSPMVNNIIQDRYGYLWFGTYNGLDRFDGIKFKSYKNKPGDTTSITCGTIRCLTEDKNGDLWIGTNTGFDKFIRKSEIFLHFKVNAQDIRAIKENKDGSIWLGTRNGLIKFNTVDNSYQYYKHDPSDLNSLNNNQIFSLFIDKNGDLLIGTNRGLDKYLHTENKFVHLWINPIYDQKLYKTGAKDKYSIFAIYEDNEGIIWLGTQNGLLEFDPVKQYSRLYEDDLNNPDSLSFHSISSICGGDNDELWIGTAVGLNLYNKSAKKFTRYFHNIRISTSLSQSNIRAVLKERSGTLWVATDGRGPNKANLITNPFIQFSEQPWRETKRFSSATITWLDKANNGSIWVGTPIGLLNYDPIINKFKDLFFDQNIRVIKEDPVGNLIIGLNISSGRGLKKIDKTGNVTDIKDSLGNKLDWLINKFVVDNDSILWACTAFNGGLIKINNKTNKYKVMLEFFNRAQTMHKDKNGFLWIGTEENGLICFDPKLNKIVKHYLSDYRNIRSISGNSITSIFEDDNGILWLGTNNGLNKLDSKQGVFFHFTESDGLPHNWVYTIFEDDKKNLWLGTHKGISKFNPQSGKFTNYDILQGLVAANKSGIGCQGYNGEIYLDSPGGLTIFYPDSVLDNPFIPPVYITSVSIMDSSILLDSIITLKYDQNFINFEFAALSYVRPQKNLYAYKLEGLDKDWIQAGTRRSASYTNLNNGEYIFWVKGSNNDGIWNEAGTSIKIIILPPWWKTGWAFTAYGLAFIFILYTVRKYDLKRQRLKHQLDLEREHAEKLEDVDRIKSNFFTNISHEFRTPLTLITGPAESILSKTSDESIKNDASIIKRNSNRLLQLVNQLLDLSKLDAGRLKLEASPGNIVSFVKGVALSFESLSESKDITLKINSEKEFIEVYFDKDKMMKIISNLLSNSFKFTLNSGKILISISEASEMYVVIKINDTGIGIPEKEMPNLFDRFYQADSSHTREFGGTGIGLALTKELVELHHGVIQIVSKESNPKTKLSGWTEVTITIPLGKSHLKSDEIVAENIKLEADSAFIEDQQNFDYKKSQELVLNHNDTKTIILVVEDNYDMREYIKKSLSDNYTVEDAVNGEQGIRMAEKIIPDLIITDLMMPKMDGNELTKKLKTDEKTSHIPIIILTAKSGQENLIEGLETGADEYLTKPFDIKELKLRISNLLKLRKNIQEKILKGELSPLAGDKKFSVLDQKFIIKVNDVVEKHLADENFSIEEFGKEIGMSRSQFHRKLKALVGKSASLYLRSVRLNKAKKMLEEGRGNIGEISFETGFSSPSYFTYCFKEEFGFPPSEIR